MSVCSETGRCDAVTGPRGSSGLGATSSVGRAAFCPDVHDGQVQCSTAHI